MSANDDEWKRQLLEESRACRRVLEALVRSQTNLTTGLRERESADHQRDKRMQGRHDELLSGLVEVVAGNARPADAIERPPGANGHVPTVVESEKPNRGDISGVVYIGGKGIDIKPEWIRTAWGMVKPLLLLGLGALFAAVAAAAKRLWSSL
jgi:hypothetical protein